MVRTVVASWLLIAATTGVASAQTCVPSPPGIVHWWPADGTATDVVGSSATALVGGVSFAAGLKGDAFALNGAGAYVQTSPLGLTAGTIETWVNPTAIIRDMRLFSQVSGPTTLGGAIGFNFTGDGTSVWVWTGAQWLRIAPNGTITQNAWNHLAFVYTGQVVTLYVDGTARGTAATRFDFETAALGIGARFLLAHGVTFAGHIDEFSIYDRTLSAGEVAALAGAGPSGKCRIAFADAGDDATANESAFVALDGSRSHAEQGLPIVSYEWTQLAGPPVELNLFDPVRPTFFAPSVNAGGATLTFQLRTSTAEGAGPPATVNVTVQNVDHPPTAIARVEAPEVAEGSTVQLDGSASYDEDGEQLTFAWEQTGGAAVTLDDPTSATPGLVAPFVGTNGDVLTFRLAVSSNGASTTDVVSVSIVNVNHAPVANAGSDDTRDEGTEVTIDGSSSSDPDGDALEFTWTQVSGPEVVVRNEQTATASFTAPVVTSGGAELMFQLTVTDTFGAISSADEVRVLVRNVNDPPACDQARPTRDVLWPPDHKLLPVGVRGVADPNDDAISVVVTEVTQDEPINGLGDGDTAPDAVVNGDGALLRAERTGGGNGRVYRVWFTASDGQGGVCDGSVKVTLPHNIKSAGQVIDDGQMYSSTRQP